MHLILIILSLLSNAQVGIATTFSGTGDKYNPFPALACYNRDLQDNDNFVAHPKLPCKSRVFLYNLRTRKGTIAIVGDRGPRAALVDLNVRVAKDIKANGMEPVILIPLPERLK